MDTKSASTGRWVCVFNRNRDGYQVPLGLEQAGMLESFVTNFYAPDSPAQRNWLPRQLRHMRADGLPRRRVSTSLPSFVLQAAAQVLHLPTRHIFPTSDHLLALKTASVARRTGAHLYCYGNYVPPPQARAPGSKLIDFEFHPHSHMTFDLLRSDAAKYPEVAQSFANEERDLGRERVVEAWRGADAIVCASTMTRKSLEYVGCDPARITVIPYGCEVPASEVRPRAAGPCRFLFVGQGIQRKGLHHLLLAWPRLAKTGAQLTLVCYHIDPGIAALADQPGVVLLGRQSREALTGHFASHDVFVMPSLVEGFGLAYLEALAQGCYVVGTDNTGLPDLPFDDSARSILPVGDIGALAGRLAQLAALKQEGRLDPEQIVAQTRNWQWSHFRRAIADHAASVLAGA